MSHLAPLCALFMVAGVSRIAGASLMPRFTSATLLARVFGVAEGLQMAALAVGAAAASLLVNWLGLRAGLVVLEPDGGRG